METAMDTTVTIDPARAIRDHPSEHLGDLLGVTQAEISKAIVGHQRSIELMLLATLARGHVLIEGPPGTAKTLLAQAMARVLGSKFQRVQFTPDTAPNEIVGTVLKRGGEEYLDKGAVFTNVLLADEINRTPPRTQAALLEAMQERHVSVKGKTYWIDPPFFVIATQNPYEHEGVYPLPESQLDRFVFKIELDYASPDEEARMISLPHRGTTPDVIGEVFPILGERAFLIVQDAVDEVELPDVAIRAIVDIVRATREGPGIELGASPRGAMHLAAVSKAHAALAGRTTVEVEDVLELAPYVLPHRILTRTGSSAEVVERAVRSVA
jgi:MoxR-like ATPase